MGWTVRMTGQRQQRLGRVFGLLLVLSLLLNPFAALPAHVAAARVAPPGSGNSAAVGPTDAIDPIAVPTPAPTVAPLPDTDYVDQALDASVAADLAAVNAFPTAPATNAVTTGGTTTGLRAASPDGSLTVGLPAGAVSAPVAVQVRPVQFPKGDPRASRAGRPLALLHELTATAPKNGARVTRFERNAILVWKIDPAVLAAAGVRGAPLKVYTYNEQTGAWEEVLSRWSAATHQLVAYTPHFSLYAVGDGFDKVNNYVPTVNSFEMDRQTGTASIQYPLNLPPGPSGFGPKVSLSYNTGNIDRVDVSQQGTSSVGWGWSLSSSYVAATQHFFTKVVVTNTISYDPWTASIATDGANGDLVKGTDGYWHTTQESFARVQYYPSMTGLYYGRQDDHWEAWSKDGTHYVFDINALAMDDNNSGSQWTTNRWLLHTATDVHGNTITYDYVYQDGNNQLHDLTAASLVNGRVRAVYPKQITYGAGGNRIQVRFHSSPRAIGAVSDISTNDISGDLYQSYRIDRVEVWRLQDAPSPSTDYYALLRAYDFTQGYNISLADPQGTVYPHLTLTGIIPRGNDGVTQLPGMTFRYWQDGDSNLNLSDKGHIWWAYNGYGGDVGYYYDAAGGDVNQAYRRVRAKKVDDGLGITPPHRVTYYYDYRGAAVTTRYLSDEVNTSYPSHTEKNEFRGFAWMREQDPLGQVTDHYFSQDDLYKAKEWRSQTGKTTSFSDGLDAAPPNANWAVSASGVFASTDPDNTANGVWGLQGGGTITRQAGVSDGTDVAIRFRVDQTNPKATPGQFNGTWKLTNATGNGEYWGLSVYSIPDGNGAYLLEPKAIWGKLVGGTLVEGSRDLSPSAPYRPKRAVDLALGYWYRVQLHTAPDGRFALELYRDGTLTSEYLQVKSSDLAEVGGSMPSLPTGQSWKFSQAVTRDDSNQYTARADAYTETRTVYSQGDTVYSDQTPVQEAARDVTKPLVGQANNCDGLTISFLPVTESWNSVYGTGAELGQTKRSKTRYLYDTYGNQNVIFEDGDPVVTGDERSTHSGYALDTTDWIVDKIGWTNTYSVTTGNVGGSNQIAQVLYYYDQQTTYNTIPAGGNGDLTKVLHVNLLKGTSAGPNSAQQFEYDAYGNQTAVIDPLNNRTATTFDPYYATFPVAVTYPNGRQETSQFDYTLDAPTSSTDQNGTTSGRSYDTFGRPKAIWTVGFTTATTPAESYSFPDLGQTSLTAPFYISYRHITAGSSTTWATRWFDGRGRSVQDVSPKDATTSIVVDSVYTNTGALASTTLPYTVNNSSPTARLMPVANQPQLTKYYDGAGRPTMVVNPDGTYTVQDYSRLLWVGTRDESGHQKWQHTDLLGRMDQVEEDNPGYTPAVVYTQYTHDKLNHLTQVTRDAGGTIPTVTTITYDGLGNKDTMTDPDMGNWQYDYDAAGNLTTQRDALYLSSPTTYADHQVFFAYDNMSRPLAKYYGQAHYTAGIADVKYYYDNALGDAASKKSWGRLRLAEVTVQGQGNAKANGHGYEYDARGLVVADVVTTTYTTRAYRVGYSYDTSERLSTLTYPAPEASPEQVTVGYNTQKMGLSVQLTSNVANNPYPVYNVNYNARGQITSLLQGSVPGGNMLTSSYTYDDATTKRGWLTNEVVTSTLGTYLNLNLGYAANGNIQSIQQTATDAGTNNVAFSNTFTYDGLERLRTATSNLYSSESYAFDSLGRMTTRTVAGVGRSYAYGDAAHKDAPTGYNSASYSYDANGQQVSRNSGGNTQTRSFDPEGRMVKVVEGTTTSDYVYDGNGQRVVQSVTSGGSTTRTLYVGSLYEEQITGSATPPYTVYYTLGGKPVALRRANQSQSSTNGQYRLVGDQLGSTTLLVDTSSTPQVSQRQYHKPYGELAWQYVPSGSLTIQNFTGQRLDATTGLLYYGARFYDPALGYFLSADGVTPASGSAQSRNHYSYVLNNPLGYNDPTGHYPGGPLLHDGAEGNERDEEVARLQKTYGVTIDNPNAWTLEEVEFILRSIADLMRVAHWTLRDFKAAMGVDMGHSIHLANGRLTGVGQLGYTQRQANGDILITLDLKKLKSKFDNQFDPAVSDGRLHSYRTWVQGTMVHELAHAWDLASNLRLSQGLGNLVNDYSSGHQMRRAGVGTYPSDYASWAYSHVQDPEQEEWAEAVTALVYPTNSEYKGFDKSSTEASYVRAQFWAVKNR